MKKKLSLSNFYLTIIGLGALIWFLIRVIPRPSRVTYPCQRAAFPIASAFVIYIVSLVSSSFAFFKFKKHWRNGSHLAATMFLIITFISALFLLQSDKPYTYAGYKSVLETPNEPIGTGVGIFPGRVVWIHDSTAVDQQCTNSSGDYWWMDSNTDQVIVSNMVSQVLKSLTGKETDAEAWDAIFRYYNQTHGRGDVGYTAGEKIVIKLNLNTGASGYSYERDDNRTIDTSPQIIYSVLDQLINYAGVAQENISFGDPGRNVDNIFWNKFHSLFPNVKYWGSGSGRTPIEPSSSKVFFTSDGKLQHYLPKCYIDATYMINIPILKQHHRAGISLTAKNHIGTFVPFTPDWNVRDSLHHSFPSSQGNGVVDNGDYHLYRLFVDIIGHEDLGGKTILYLIDGLWSSTNWGDPPWKWRMAPFNNSYPASIFASLDPVAIESVGFDFLFNEFYVGNPSGNAFPHYSGVDDFLHQAADSVNWPEDILYDPEEDGSHLPRSMGVHEHWNNADEKKYSRNLGINKGIELIQLISTVELKAKVFLEGPYAQDDTMFTDLNWRNVLENNVLAQPYDVAPWNYAGVESVGLSFFDGNPTIVDWVLVELRRGETAATATTVATRAAFIESDGNIVDLDGTSPVKFNCVAGDYYLVVKHRNHLAVMSADIVTLPNRTTYDFTTGSDQFYGTTTAANELEANIWGMIAGDGNGNGQIQNNDSEDIWKPDNGSSGYRDSDFNMNGQVQNNDNEDYWKLNNGRGSQVPTIP